MKLPKEAKRASIIAGGFALFMGAILLVAYLLRDAPSPYDACVHKCAALNKSGQLVYQGQWTSKPIAREANSVCECQ